MNIRTPLLVSVFSVSARMYADTAIDLSRFQVKIEKGAQAQAEVVNDPDDGEKALIVTVAKPGPEFWSVELRAPGFQFQAAKHYELKFRAKSSPAEYVYFVAEKDSGNQESIARGTTLRIPEQWADCPIVLHVLHNGTPGHSPLSHLPLHPSTFLFRHFL